MHARARVGNHSAAPAPPRCPFTRRYYALVLEHERNKQQVRAGAGAPPAAGSFYVEVMRIRELISGITLDLDLAPSLTIGAVKDRVHEIQNVNKACVGIMAGCDVLSEGAVLQVSVVCGACPCCNLRRRISSCAMIVLRTVLQCVTRCAGCRRAPVLAQHAGVLAVHYAGHGGRAAQRQHPQVA